MFSLPARIHRGEVKHHHSRHCSVSSAIRTRPKVKHASFQRPHARAVLWHHELPPLAPHHLYEPVVAASTVEVRASDQHGGVRGRFSDDELSSDKVGIIWQKEGSRLDDHGSVNKCAALALTGVAQPWPDPVQLKAAPHHLVAAFLQSQSVVCFHPRKGEARFGWEEQVLLQPNDH